LFLWLSTSEVPTREDVIGGALILLGVLVVGSGGQSRDHAVDVAAAAGATAAPVTYGTL